MKTTTSTIATFAASVVFACGAAISIASTAAVSQAAPTLLRTAPVEVIRLEPVTVTISKARFDEIRAQTTELARTNDSKKVTRG